MDPAKFGLIAGTIGLEFALAQTLAAIAMGLLGGFGTALLVRRGLLGDALRQGGTKLSCCARQRTLHPPPPQWRFWNEPARTQRFVLETAGMSWFLARWLAVAFLLESLMVAWLPGDAVARHLGGGDTLLAIPAAVLLGVPTYLNGYAAVPLVQGLINLGMSPAVGLAFVTAGAATSIPAALAVWALVRPPVFLGYLGFATVGSLAVGYAYAAFLGWG
jgi:uncharacterized membrane protein YraQ (UPF0718 family)